MINKEFSTGQTLTICYDYLYKSAKYVNYTLEGEYVDDGNINDRPSFYTEDSISYEYQVYPSDYINSGYDRGHLAPDASFDYSEEDLYLIYTMANIIPQDPNVNRYFWTKAENYEREMAIRLEEVEVLNGVVFESNPKYINNQIAISKGFWKRIRNTNQSFERCFYYDNFVLFDASEDTLDKHEVDCSSL
ncbi:MAG: DNA/RNA non-specific endonuclease [Campylobacterota bacterium]|nr:DNA/RNA non-specific endonuclease [Campylobacterota bacterium]